MTVSSRTPEGSPGQCPICARQICIEPSTYPTNDATCPNCGSLITFEWLGHAEPYATAITIQESDEAVAFDIVDRVLWMFVALFTTIVIQLNDQSVLITVVWLAAILFFSQKILPDVVSRWSEFVNRENKFWLGVVLGWGMTAGLPWGAIFGVLIPYVHPMAINSCIGGTIGLLLGPLAAAMQGLIVASIASFVAWVITGSSLAES